MKMQRKFESNKKTREVKKRIKMEGIIASY